MGYVDDNLIAGEQVLYRTHLHWIVYLSSVLAFVLLSFVALAIFLDQRDKGLATLIFVFPLLPILRTFLIRRSSEFAVTNKRVLLKTGILKRHTVETLLTKVENISVDQSIAGRMLNYGTITITGTGSTKEMFETIAEPLEFRKQVQSATLNIEEQRRPSR